MSFNSGITVDLSEEHTDMIVKHMKKAFWKYRKAGDTENRKIAEDIIWALGRGD